MSKNRGNPDLARPGGMHDALAVEEARIAEQRRAGTTPTTTPTSTNGSPR
ncbi:MAG TPA: hypothetical protein VGL02_20655 [Streptomyces sp.]